MIERYEFGTPEMWTRIPDKYFQIPAEIIYGLELGEKRVTVFSYFSVRRGLDSRLTFSVNDIVTWSGKKPDRHMDGINNKVQSVIECLSENGYLSNVEISKHSSVNEVQFNLNRVLEQCDTERFAIIYVDELMKIMSYCSSAPKDSLHNIDTILLVFAYLRMKIYRRRNKLLQDEINIENKDSHELDIESRRLRAPEVYDGYYYEIANDLGLSYRNVSDAVTVLSDLGLVYFEALPKIKRISENGNESWRTDHTLFCNMYKRENSYLLASGSEYYRREVRNKKIKLKLIRAETGFHL